MTMILSLQLGKRNIYQNKRREQGGQIIKNNEPTRLDIYGVLKDCAECSIYLAKKCETPQYNAPNLTHFFCARKENKGE